MPSRPIPDDECRLALDLLEEHGEYRAAADASPWSETSFRRRVMQGRERGMDTADGLRLKGTSTLYDEEGNVKLQWVKTDVDKERQQELFKEAIQALAKDLPRVTIKPPKPTEADLMANYIIGDQHHGMLAWEQETGQDYDIEISQQLLMGAFDHLVDCAPNCKKGAVVFGGDFFHYDSTIPETPAHKNTLDADSRFQKMVTTGIDLARYAIERPAKKHEEVDVYVLPGNHDPYSSVFLAACLANIYENNARIKICTSPRLYQYFRFGKTLVGLHHGHKTKMKDLPLLMATDRPEDWGETNYRYWWTFHVHHDQELTKKEHPGCRVESFRVLAAPDAYAAQEGYRSMQDMKAVILHKTAGEVTRYIVNPEMLR